MKSVEKSAKVYEDALEAALQELNASISDVNVEVLEEGSKGLFGLFGSRPYKIRVSLKEESVSADEDLDVLSLLSEKKEKETRPERKPRPRQEAPRAEESAETAAEAEKPVPEKKPARRPEPVRRQNPDRKPKPMEQEQPAEEVPAPVEAPAEEVPAEEAPAAPRRQRSRGGKGRRKPAGSAENKAESQAEDAGESKPLPPKPVVKPLEKPVVTMIPAEELDPESPAGRAKAFLAELTHLMGVEVDIQMGTDAEGNVFGYMTGDTLGVLIGRRGETLDAVQYLTSLRVNRGQEGYLRVTLDTENYRAKREDTLIRLANRMANRAVKTGRRVALEPMNPYERRIIHSALQSYDAVDTHSEGDEPNRHVVITLRKN